MAGFVGNKYYNDPNLGRVAANLSSLFAPPAARDIAAMNQDKRLQMLFESGADPSASSALIGVQGYGDTPTGYGAGLKSAESIAANDAAQRLAGVRYTADQALAGTQYGADQELLAAAFGSTFGTPVGEGEVMRAVPEGIGAKVGFGQGVEGIAGPAKPLTSDQLTAQIRQKVMAGDPDLELAFALDGVNSVEVAGPNGPVYMPEGMAAYGGAPAFANTGASPSLQQKIYINGQTGESIMGTFDPATGAARDATGAPIPPGFLPYDVPKTEGSAADTGFNPTTRNISEGNEIAVTADYALGRTAAFRTLLENNPGIMGVPGKVRKLVQDVRLTVDDLAAAYGPEAPVTLDQVMQAADRVAKATGAAGEYDPALPQAQAYALEMAYLAAKMKDPSGEVNVREMQTQLGRFDGGIGGNFNVLAALDVLDEEIRARGTAGDQLRGAGAGAAPPPADPIAQARDAIAKGADRNAVRQRLIDSGIEPPGDL